MSRRTIRLFAAFAAAVMILAVFAVITRTVSASAQGNPSPGSVTATAVPGMSLVTSAGTTTTGFHETFQRWDGVFEPTSALNRSSGDWPYLVTEDGTSFTVTRLGSSFTQAKVPGGLYDFEPSAIKETIVLSDRTSAPFNAIGVGLWGSYLPYANGTKVDLIDGHGDVVWQSLPFTAHDSSPETKQYANPVQSVDWSPGGLTLRLDSAMLTWAEYPIYLDPTWVLKGTTSNGWTGTLDGLTSDRGDANLRLGVLADDFNDNVNEIWTVTAGNSFSLSGGRAALTATEIHASGSWTNLSLGTTVNFASCGAANLMFRYASSSNEYYLKLDFGGKTLTLYKVINGVTTALSSAITVSISKATNYDVKVVGRGNAFEIWWAGVKKWSGADLSPPGTPLSGNVGISETTSKCTLYVDNVRARDPAKWSGNYTSVKRGAASGNVATQVRFLGTVDAYNVTDMWVNSSSDNVTWGGWHLVKTMAAPNTYYPIPDVDQKRYYQIRAVLRTGIDGTSSVSEVDATESSPPANVVAATNTGHAPWYVFVGGAVNSVSGNLVLTMPGISIPARGDSIPIAPVYNSALAGTPGPFGLGTMDEFHGKLSFPGGGNVTLTAGDGAVYTFITTGGTAYSPPPGIHDNLIKNADGTYTLWQPDGSRANFDATGKLTALVDRNGNHRTLTYTSGNPTRIADDSGLALTLTYDASNRVKTVTDPVGRTVTYNYDASGRLAQVVDPMGFTGNYTSYDASNRLLIRVDPAGHVDRFVYDASGRATQMWVGEWNFATNAIRWQVEEYALAYVSGTQTTVTNALGGVTTITVNSQGNPTNISGPSVGCGLCTGGNSTAYTWDGEFDRLTAMDGRGDTTTITYDWMGNVLATRDPGGNTTGQTFVNVQNATQFIVLLTSVTTPRGFTTRYTYTGNGNLYSTVHPDNAVSYRYYDVAGSLVRLQDFRGNSVTYGYDAHEFRINSTDAGGNRTTYQNDNIGRTWNVTSPGGNTTRRVYDLDSRMTSVTDPMGNTTSYAYDKDGRRTRATDPNNLVTSSSYNLTFGTLQQHTSAGNNVTRYVYDVLGDRNETIDANGHVTTYGFDAFRRMANETTPLSRVTKFVYDRAGNLVVKTEPNGTILRYGYDRSNRLLRSLYPDGSSQLVAYDADGNVQERKAFELDDFYVHDKLDRVNQTRQVFLDVALTVWHNYTYDANGNRLSMDGYGGGTYTWDTNNRIRTETDASGKTWTYAYGRDGQLLTETYPDGEFVTYRYDRDGRLVLQTTHRPDGSVLENVSYVYDKVGNVVTKQTPATSQGVSSWYIAGSTSITMNLTASGLSPSPQTVAVSVTAAGTMIGGEPGMPDTAFVAYYYVLNHGAPTYLGTDSYSLTGTLKHFSGGYSTSVSVRNGDVLQGEIVFSSNSGLSTETTTSLGSSITSGTNPTTYTYDREYRIVKVVNPNATYATYTYDAVGNWLTMGNGTSTITASYNADDQLTSSSDGTAYTYDPNGNLLTSSVGGVTTHRSYDYANDLTPYSTTQMVSTSCSGCNITGNFRLLTLEPSPQSKTITANGSGNLADDVDYPSHCPTVTLSWEYVLQGVAHVLGSQSFTLVANSRLLTCWARYTGSYSSAAPVALQSNWSLAGEVFLPAGNTYFVEPSPSTSVYAGTVVVSPYLVLEYGADGILSSEVVNLAPTTTHYGYDLVGMGRLPQRIAEFDGTAVAASYFYSVGSDRVLETIQGTSGYYYHRDVLGSTTTVTDSAGRVRATYGYDAYGNLLPGSSDTIGNPLRFTGLASDPTSGLLYARARWYDPSTGRFLTPDPAGCGSRPSCACQGGSAYSYAGDNPVNRVDPTGRFANPSRLFDGGAEMQSDWEFTHYGQGWSYVPPGTPSSIPEYDWDCVKDKFGNDCMCLVGTLVALGFITVAPEVAAFLAGAALNCADLTPPGLCTWCTYICTGAVVFEDPAAGAACGACLLIELGIDMSQCPEKT